MKLLFSLVLASALQAGVVGMVLLLVRAVLRRWLPAKWVCVLWLVLLCKLVFPFGPESGISLFNAAPVSVRQAVSAVRTVPDQMGAESAAAAPAADWLAVGGKIWLAGCMAMLLWMFVTRLLLAVRLRRTGKPAGARIERLLEDCQMRLCVPQAVRVTVQEGVAAPSLLGLVRPKILLPEYVGDMPDGSICYILLHELSHIKRCDQWLNACLLVLRAVFWFQPVVWLCFRLLRQDMELATDERVLQSIGADCRMAYGESLLDTLHRMSGLSFMPRMLGLVGGRKSLMERLKRIARFRQSSFLCTMLGMLLVVVLSGLCLTSAETLLPAPAAQVLSPTLPVIAAVEPESSETESAEPAPILPETEQPAKQAEPDQPAKQAAPETDQSVSQPPELPDAMPEQPSLPEQAVKATAPSEGITSQLMELLPGTDIGVLEQYAQAEGRTAGAEGSNLKDSYYIWDYTLTAQTPSAEVAVAADENGVVTYLVENTINVDLPVQIIDPETRRRMYRGYGVVGSPRWAESVTGLIPGKTYLLRLEYPSQTNAACTGEVIIY